MLGRLYHLSCSGALRYTQAFHDSRKFPQGVRSPQTTVQVTQVSHVPGRLELPSGQQPPAAEAGLFGSPPLRLQLLSSGAWLRSLTCAPDLPPYWSRRCGACCLTHPTLEASSTSETTPSS